MAAGFGVAPQTVRKWASKLGVKKARLTANHDYFRTWSPSVAYDLGYIYTDGNVQPNGKIQLQCCSRDEDIIAGILDRVGSRNKLTRRKRTERNGTITERSYTAIFSVRMTRCLIETHGILPAKSKLNIPFPSVPDEYLPHFLRGALDGDGTVSNSLRKNRETMYVGWLGQHRFIRELTARLHKAMTLTEVKVHEKRHNLLYVKWAALKDLVTLHQFLYPPGDYPFLARKRETFEKYLGRKGYSNGS